MKQIIALDADGVLLDYHQAYRTAWLKAFGRLPEIRDPQAYWPMDRFDVGHLSGAELAHFRSHFDETFWATIPAVPRAVDACEALVAAEYELVCVSAFDERYLAARTQNLRDLGFPIRSVIATRNSSNAVSPKAGALQDLRPAAFVDDFAPYLRAIPAEIHAALILREPNGSPNTGHDLSLAHSQHADLEGFSNWWLRTRHA
jgi:phosphoglycolate phosphatase-like HAD superfamily hydrolase